LIFDVQLRGPREDSLRQLVRDCDLEDRVVLAGAQRRNEILDAYRASDLFVLACVVGRSGDRDGIPVVLMEALAMQVPSISTQVSGIPELVRHKETGWLVPERNASALADAIVTLADDGKLRADLARNGRSLVEKEFEIKANAGRSLDVFRKVVDEAWPQRPSDAGVSGTHAAKGMLK
jgi:colanic acid/amylovoran biosynthesis glycosyltransferase